jgi:bifunctional DNase/RNase
MCAMQPVHLDNAIGQRASVLPEKRDNTAVFLHLRWLVVPKPAILRITSPSRLMSFDGNGLGEAYMIEVTIDSIRVSLMSQHRIVLLKDVGSDRYLPIWIGPCEADAITVELQEVEVSRPLTHDLLKSVISEMGAEVVQIVINDLRNDVFYAQIVVDLNGRRLEIDSRPSDAIALAVRVHVPIYVEESVMERAASTPEQEVEGEQQNTETPDERLSIFKDFVDTLDLDDLDDNE